MFTRSCSPRIVVRQMEPFDVVMFADVLEHLADPFSLLCIAKTALAPAGSIVASVPNTAHWSVRSDLFRGRFEYRKWGIMDATHLRWFTSSSLRFLFESAGLSVQAERVTAGIDLDCYSERLPWRRMSRKTRASLVRRWSQSVAAVVRMPAGRESGACQPRDAKLTATPRAIALYLPQFHPISENDAWWGRGFTEWTNVTRARPLFRGHYQPHLPGRSRLLRPTLARRSVRAGRAGAYSRHLGLLLLPLLVFRPDGLLERPFEEVSGRQVSLEFPFCLCWANESWTRRWLGEEREVLLKQEYSPKDDENHGRFLARAFADPRYIPSSRPPVVPRLASKAPVRTPSGTVARIAEAVEREGVTRPFFLGVDSTLSRRGLSRPSVSTRP